METKMEEKLECNEKCKGMKGCVTSKGERKNREREKEGTRQILQPWIHSARPTHQERARETSGWNGKLSCPLMT